MQGAMSKDEFPGINLIAAVQKIDGKVNANNMIHNKTQKVRTK